MARVDVVMPVRNGEAFVEDAIRSVIAQTDRDWRLIVLNHASTDGTGDVIDRLHLEDRRVERHDCDASLSLSDVRNAGFDCSDAPFIMLHDADDLSVPERIAVLVAEMERQPQLALVGSNYVTVDAALKPLGTRTLPGDPDRLAVAAIFSNPIAQPTVMLRRAALDAAQGRYGKTFLQPSDGPPPMTVATLVEDYLMFGQLAIEGRCATVPDQLVLYRWHGGNTSSVNFQRQMELSLEISRHLMALVAASRGVEYRDPAPFCNHGARLEPTPAGGFRGQWLPLRRAILAAFGDTPGVRRELAFRQVLGTRSLPAILVRFARFCLSHRPDSDELATIRSFVAKTVRRR